MFERWMSEALKEAKNAGQMGEVPVGAVAILENTIIARSHNLRERTNNPLGHAEILLLQELLACRMTHNTQRSWRMEDIAVVVTLEPCVMCMGALMQARISRLVFGANDPKAGACGSGYDLIGDRKLPHRMEIVAGTMKEECQALLQDFFKELRR